MRKTEQNSSEAARLEAEAKAEVEKYFKVGKFSPEDCEGCSVCYPSSLNLDQDPLYNTANNVKAQILVATGQNNWTHDIGDEPENWGRVCKVLSGASKTLADLVDGPIRINGTDQEFDDADDQNKVAITILPQFIRINTDVEHCLEDVTRVLKVLQGGPLDEDMMAVPERGFIILCSHRTRDKRCAVTAPLMRKALDIALRDAGLYRDFDDDTKGGVRVLLSNHVGGHKFAANALIYQNTGMALMLGRLRPEHAKTLVEKTIEKDEIVPKHVRFCTKIASYVW